MYVYQQLNELLNMLLQQQQQMSLVPKCFRVLNQSEIEYVDVKKCSIEESKKGTRLEASKTLFLTAIQTGFVYHLSIFLFEELFLLYSWIRNHFQRVEKQKLVSKHHRLLNNQIETTTTLQSFVNKSFKNLLVCLVAILGEGLGVVLGNLCRPGVGAVCGGVVCSNAAYWIQE